MLSKDAKLGLLRRVPRFAALSPRELAAVAAATAVVDVPARQDLVHPDGPTRRLGVIVEGAADVTVAGTTTATLGAGDAFGELAQATTDVQATTVTTTQPTRILELTDDAYAGLLAEVPSLRSSVTRTPPADSGDGHIGFD